MSQADRDRYKAACHAMQTGVGAMMAAQFGGGREVEPKHLRVGVNSSMCDGVALARLLMAKGVFTQDEYEKALADEMEREVERYKAALKNCYGKDFDLI